MLRLEALIVGGNFDLDVGRRRWPRRTSRAVTCVSVSPEQRWIHREGVRDGEGEAGRRDGVREKKTEREREWEP